TQNSAAAPATAQSTPAPVAAGDAANSNTVQPDVENPPPIDATAAVNKAKDNVTATLNQKLAENAPKQKLPENPPKQELAEKTPKKKAGVNTPAGPSPELLKAQQYLQGRGGVAPNCEQGLVYLRAAAQKNEPAAAVQMSTLYATGHCVQMDRVMAYR